MILRSASREIYAGRRDPANSRAAAWLVLAIAAFGIAFGAAVTLMACAPAAL